MYYKIEAGTPTYEKLLELQGRITACNKAARELSEQQGAATYAASSRTVGGGIAALCFASKPAGYKLVQAPNYYYPKSIKANSALHDAIAALPLVTNKELNDLLGYVAGLTSEGERMYFSTRPGVTWGEGWVAVDAGRSGLKGNADAVEILESEWRALTAKPQPVAA